MLLPDLTPYTIRRDGCRSATGGLRASTSGIWDLAITSSRFPRRNGVRVVAGREQNHPAAYGQRTSNICPHRWQRHPWKPGPGNFAYLVAGWFQNCSGRTPKNNQEHLISLDLQPSMAVIARLLIRQTQDKEVLTSAVNTSNCLVEWLRRTISKPRITAPLMQSIARTQSLGCCPSTPTVLHPALGSGQVCKAKDVTQSGSTQCRVRPE